MTAIALPILLAGVGAAIDMQRLQSAGVLMQDVADASALAGAAKARDDNATTNAQATVLKVAQPMLLGLEGPTPSISVTPTGGVEPQVVVQVQQTVPLIFGQLYNKSAQTVSRTATAVAGKRTPLCMLALDPSSTQALYMQGNPDIKAPGCAVQVNSASATALHAGGSPSATTAGFYVAGAGSGGGGFSPAPTFNSPTFADPMASQVTWPSSSLTCNYNNTVVKNASVTLQPGTYCGGIDVQANGNATFAAGVYVIKTGDFNVKANAVARGASNVTIVLIDPNGVVSIHSNGSLELSSPKTGPWANLAIAVKPQATAKTSSLGGGSNVVLDGIIYAPSQTLDITGGGDMTITTDRMLIANKIRMSGNGKILAKGNPSIMAVGGEVRIKS